EATWSFDFDDFGNLKTSSDPNGYTLTYGYDELTHSFRTSVRDSFGYQSGSAPNYLYGTLAEETDINGHTIAYHHDDFGRLVEVWGPDDPEGQGEPTLAFDYALQSDQTAALPLWARTRHKDVLHPGD